MDDKLKCKSQNTGVHLYDPGLDKFLTQDTKKKKKKKKNHTAKEKKWTVDLSKLKIFVLQIIPTEKYKDNIKKWKNTCGSRNWQEPCIHQVWRILTTQ